MTLTLLPKLVSFDTYPFRRSQVPFMTEHPVDEKDGPFIVSSTKGRFILAPRSAKTGIVRFGYFRCPAEYQLLNTLFEDCWSISEAEGWGNRVASVSEGVKRMSSFGLVPKFLMSAEDPGGHSLTFIRASIMGTIITTLASLTGVGCFLQGHAGLLLLNASRAMVLCPSSTK